MRMFIMFIMAPTGQVTLYPCILYFKQVDSHRQLRFALEIVEIRYIWTRYEFKKIHMSQQTDSRRVLYGVGVQDKSHSSETSEYSPPVREIVSRHNPKASVKLQ